MVVIVLEAISARPSDPVPSTGLIRGVAIAHPGKLLLPSKPAARFVSMTEVPQGTDGITAAPRTGSSCHEQTLKTLGKAMPAGHIDRIPATMQLHLYGRVPSRMCNLIALRLGRPRALLCCA